jgi:hypothetical protein
MPCPWCRAPAPRSALPAALHRSPPPTSTHPGLQSRGHIDPGIRVNYSSTYRFSRDVIFRNQFYFVTAGSASAVAFCVDRHARSTSDSKCLLPLRIKGQSKPYRELRRLTARVRQSGVRMRRIAARSAERRNRASCGEICGFLFTYATMKRTRFSFPVR